MGLGIGAVGGYFGNFDFTLGCGIRMGVGQVKPDFDPNIIRFFGCPKKNKKKDYNESCSSHYSTNGWNSGFLLSFPYDFAHYYLFQISN